MSFTEVVKIVPAGMTRLLWDVGTSATLIDIVALDAFIDDGV